MATDGGTSSATGENKFANGAQTAAIQYLFNQVSDKSKSKSEADARHDKAVEVGKTAGTNAVSTVADELIKVPGGASTGQSISLAVNIAEQASTGNYDVASTFGTVAGSVAGTVAGGVLLVPPLLLY
ncbi:hypothetical protein AB835_12980 [Candidatus Endobugula sertula]|uniref:Uncharacterized protein n=1 Tax=Candidatus Endobugula sertula TaxID=62101 RepID=A0A1D2QM43_9GAMM|nr:hypothetical protein AB835_12980 [Candidatus Endobugula sertula]